MNGSSYLVLFGGLVSLSWNGDTWTFGGGDFSLPVELASFAAEAGDSQVKLIWTTQSEIDCAGFNIYRAAEPDGERQRLNPRLIPGAGTSTQPHDYDYTDYQANNGQTYFYYLENQDYSGLTALYGPIEATPMAASSGGIPTAFALQANFPNPSIPAPGWPLSAERVRGRVGCFYPPRCPGPHIGARGAKGRFASALLERHG
jgi:hypothetical protein